LGIILPSETDVKSSDLEQLRAAASPGPVLILTHDNPDPDSLASGKALSLLLKQAWDIPSRLIYSGLVLRPENRMMLRRLTPEWEHREVLPALKDFSAVALVDTQPGAGNNRLRDLDVNLIVFDHHRPIRESKTSIRYAALNPQLGSTTSLLYQHLEAAGIEPDPALSTAMFYGVKSDTLSLSRGASEIDEVVYLKLLARIDRDELVRIEQAGLPREYYSAFTRGLQAAKIYGSVIIARLGRLDRPDFAAEIADLLIRLDGTRAVLTLGQHNEMLQVSVRTRPMGRDAGLLIQQLILPPGTAGGHGPVAGGQVPLMDAPLEQVTQEIETRFLNVMDEVGPGEPLLN
jgi:nanoRNase/pAp phosphatase (c-di-AMP/oligoRNAs hydrolase)